MSRWLWTAELWTPLNITKGVALPSGCVRPKGASPSGPRSGPLADRLEGRLELLRARVVPQLAQGLGLHLADALAGPMDGPPAPVEGVVEAVCDADAVLQDLRLVRREGLHASTRLIV